MLDIIARVAPGFAVDFMRKRLVFDSMRRGYEAGKPSQFRKKKGDPLSADSHTGMAAIRMREWARDLDANHDIVTGVLDDLIANVIGTGMIIEPMVKSKSGELQKQTNDAIREGWREFWAAPEVTGELSGVEVERLVCRTWLRDGEIFVHHITMQGGAAPHRTGIPYSVELLESDYVPYDMVSGAGLSAGSTIVYGVEKNTWGRPLAYHVFKNHPGNTQAALSRDLKRVSADEMLHVKFMRRLHQTRGVTIFHSSFTRLDDVKDYEESERIAARVASASCAAIKRSFECATTSKNTDGSRAFEMSPGMIYDNLLPGESIEMIKADRPNTALEGFRNSQLRAVASGTMTRFSSIAKNYNGTYSAQRQELVEGSMAYRMLGAILIGDFYRPVYRNAVNAMIAAGRVRLQSGIDIYAADIRGPSLPWIQPEQEMSAFGKSLEIKVKSRQQIIRDLGGDPQSVDQEILSDVFRPELPGAEVIVTKPLRPKADFGNDADEEVSEDANEDQEEAA